MQLLNMEKQITSLLLANNLPIFDPFCLWVSAERQALEPILSRNIIKLQIINNQALFGVHSKSKSF